MSGMHSTSNVKLMLLKHPQPLSLNRTSRFLPENTKIVGYGRSSKTAEQLHEKIVGKLPGTDTENQKFLKTVSILPVDASRTPVSCWQSVKAWSPCSVPPCACVPWHCRTSNCWCSMDKQRESDVCSIRVQVFGCE